MAQQQLIMIILGVIIVGIAVAVGINMFAGISVASEPTALVRIGLVDVTTTAASQYNNDFDLWTTTATTGSSVVCVLSKQELPVANTFTVERYGLRNSTFQYDVYLIQ